MNKPKLGNDLYGQIIRWGGVVLAVLLWLISMRFSIGGFQIVSQEDWWVGLVLGATVTYLQILFNRGAKNETIWWFGVLAYVYGVSTNLIGIMALRDNNFTMQWLSENPIEFILQLSIVIAIAATVEILPEHLLINGMRDDGADGDFFGALRDGIPRRGSAASRQNNQRKDSGSQNRGQQQQQRNRGQGQQQNQQGHQVQGQGHGRTRREESDERPSRSHPRVIGGEESLQEVRYPVRRE